MSNKVPGQAEKWDDVIRQLTSVWTPESAARVLAAIAQLDLHGSSSEGDVLTRVGDKFVPRPASGGGSGVQVVHKSANYAVQASESGTTFVADVDGKVFTLPLVADSLTYTFIDTVGGTGTIVRPQPTERLYDPGNSDHPNPGVGKGVIAFEGLGAPAMVVTVLGVAGVGWITTSQTPQWTYES